MKYKILATIVLGLSFNITTQAALVARGTDMVYDTINNITWAADANLFKTQTDSNPVLVSEIIAANGGVIHDVPNTLDTVPNSGTYTLTTADFDISTGRMTWWGAQAWANNLSLGGVTGWILPTTTVQSVGYNQTGSQLGDLYYNQLGGVANTFITATHNANYNLFSNVQNHYISSSSNESDSANAWLFFIGVDDQGTPYQGFQDNWNPKSSLSYAWAVRPGDVTAVPLPGAVWLFLTGMIGLMGLKRRGSIG